MKIQILGPGCPKCKQLAEAADLAAKELGVDYEIVKVTDVNDIMNFGVMMTPSIAVDGEVMSVGKVLSKQEILSILKK